jgi:hypothetical protein
MNSHFEHGSMNSKLRLHKPAVFGRALIVACALVSISSVKANTLTLPDASSGVGVAGYLCSSVEFFSSVVRVNCPSLKPGASTGFDGELPDGTTVSGRATTALLFGPAASVQGNGGSLWAEVDYFAEVVPAPGIGIPVGILPSVVPVTFTASVRAAAGGDLTWGFARAAMGYVGAIDACVNFFFAVGQMCVSSPTNSLTGNVPINVQVPLSVTAAGNAPPDGGFEVTADPVFAIADELIPGTNINFRDAFTFEISPNVTPSVTPGPTAVPEPATLIPLALIAVFSLGARLLAYLLAHLRSGTPRRRAVSGL